MKYTREGYGPTIVENEVLAAARALVAAIHRVGAGELADSEKLLLAAAAEAERDRVLFEAIASEVAYLVTMREVALGRGGASR